MNPKCEDCRFWVRWLKLATDTGEPTCGNCRRFPPNHEGFPKTTDNTWCGEFEHKDADLD